MSVHPEARLRASEETLAFHRSAFVFDGLALSYVLEEPYISRMLEGGVNAINVSIGGEAEGWDETLRHLEQCLESVERSPHLVHATSVEEVLEAKNGNKIAVVLGTQNASMLDTELWRLDLMYRMGFRFFAPAYTGASLFADGCGEFRDAGISVLGQELIERANEVGMVIDLSHCGHRSRLEGAQLARFPACTHSNAYAVTVNDRNTKDEAIEVIAQKGGVIGLFGLPRAVWPEAPTLDHLFEHLDHIVNLVGPEHVGFGWDFTEGFQDKFAMSNTDTAPPPTKWRVVRPDIFGSTHDFYTQPYPERLESIARLPNFTQGMRDRGYDDEVIEGVLGGNWLRVLSAAEGAG